MTERKDKLTPSKIVFFDADKTLWQVFSKDPTQDDWASKGKTRTFTLMAEGVVVRTEDSTRFTLKNGVDETIHKLNKEGVIVGSISDNDYEDVEKVCQLLGIWQYFDQGFVNVRLWKGPADKIQMISEVLDSNPQTQNSKVLLVDDSERYASQMANSGHNFILSPKDTFPKDIILGFFGI